MCHKINISKKHTPTSAGLEFAWQYSSSSACLQKQKLSADGEGLFVWLCFVFPSLGWACTSVTANKGKGRCSTAFPIALITLLLKLSLSARRL